MKTSTPRRYQQLQPEDLATIDHRYFEGYRMKPRRLAESMSGHSSGGSEFNIYTTVGYTVEQKLEELNRIAI